MKIKVTRTKNLKIKEASDLLIEGGSGLSTLFAKDGLLKELTKNIVERALQGEMEEHLGYSKYTRSEEENARNGSFSKSLVTDNGI